MQEEARGGSAKQKTKRQRRESGWGISYRRPRHFCRPVAGHTRRTPPWRIRLKARVDHADQTTRIYTQKYVKYVKMVVLTTLKV